MAENIMLDNLVEIARFSSPTEAAVARNSIAEDGIPACLDGEAMASWFWFYGPAIGGVKLYVEERDAERAIDILSTSSEAADFDAIDYQDESADEDDDGEEELSPHLLHAFRASIIGLLFFPPLLNIYSVFLILRHKLLRPPINWRIGIACAVNAFVFLLVCMFVHTVIMPPQTSEPEYHIAPDGTREEVKYEVRTRIVSIPLIPSKPISVSTGTEKAPWPRSEVQQKIPVTKSDKAGKSKRDDGAIGK